LKILSIDQGINEVYETCYVDTMTEDSQDDNYNFMLQYGSYHVNYFETINP